MNANEITTTWEALRRIWPTLPTEITPDWRERLTELRATPVAVERAGRLLRDRGDDDPTADEVVSLIATDIDATCPRCSAVQPGLRLGYIRDPIRPEYLRMLAVRCTCNGGDGSVPAGWVETIHYDDAEKQLGLT